MNKLTVASISVLLAAGSAAAQSWDFGAVGGLSVYKSSSATAGSNTASLNYSTGPAVGAVLGNNIYEHLGGELRYLYSQNDLDIKTAAGKSTYGTESHLVHYDVLAYPTPSSSRLRPYASAGFGMRLYRGNGVPIAPPPASPVVFTNQTQWKPAIAVGGGLKCKMSPHVMFRAEFRTFMSPVPQKVLTNASGWLYGFVPLFGFSATY